MHATSLCLQILCQLCHHSVVTHITMFLIWTINRNNTAFEQVNFNFYLHISAFRSKWCLHFVSITRCFMIFNLCPQIFDFLFRSKVLMIMACSKWFYDVDHSISLLVEFRLQKSRSFVEFRTFFKTLIQDFDNFLFKVTFCVDTSTAGRFMSSNGTVLLSNFAFLLLLIEEIRYIIEILSLLFHVQSRNEPQSLSRQQRWRHISCTRIMTSPEQ